MLWMTIGGIRMTVNPPGYEPLKSKSQVRYVAYFPFGVKCGKCGYILTPGREDEQILCGNPKCELFGIEFKTPLVELERVEEK